MEDYRDLLYLLKEVGSQKRWWRACKVCGYASEVAKRGAYQKCTNDGSRA